MPSFNTILLDDLELNWIGLSQNGLDATLPSSPLTIVTVQNQQSRQTTNAVITCMPFLGSLEGVPGSPKTTKKKEGQEMPRLSLLACNAECHHANAEAEPPGMSGGQGKDATKGEKDWR